MTSELKDSNTSVTDCMPLEEFRKEFVRECKVLFSGVDASSLSNTLKIQKEFIEAIQEGRFEALPTPVVAKGFIRNICRALKQNPEKLLLLYDQVTQIPKSTEIIERDSHPSPNPTRFINLGDRKTRWILAGSATCLFVIAGLSFQWSSQTRLGKGDWDEDVAETVEESLIAERIQEIQTEPEAPPESVSNTVLGDSVESSMSAQPEQFEAQGLEQAELNQEPQVAPLDQAQTLLVSPSQKDRVSNQVQKLEIQVFENGVRVDLCVDQDPCQNLELDKKTHVYTFKDKAELTVFEPQKIGLRYNNRYVSAVAGGTRKFSFVDPASAKLQ